MLHEVAEASLGCLYTLDRCVWVNVKLASGNNVLDILGCLLYITLDIHSETRSFRDGEAKIESDNTRNTAKTDENTPAIVYMFEIIDRVVNDLLLVPLHHNERNESSN